MDVSEERAAMLTADAVTHELVRLREEVRRLREVLKPFAKEGEQWAAANSSDNDLRLIVAEDWAFVERQVREAVFTIGDLKNAARALFNMAPAPEPQPHSSMPPYAVTARRAALEEVLSILDRINCQDEDAAFSEGINECARSVAQDVRRLIDALPIGRVAEPERPEVVAQRSHLDYAVEFGKYLADTAEAFMAEQNRATEAEEIPNSDFWRGLQSAIHEFRKRAALASP
jgi:hypothetical protein